MITIKVFSRTLVAYIFLFFFFNQISMNYEHSKLLSVLFVLLLCRYFAYLYISFKSHFLRFFFLLLASLCVFFLHSALHFFGVRWLLSTQRISAKQISLSLSLCIRAKRKLPGVDFHFWPWPWCLLWRHTTLACWSEPYYAKQKWKHIHIYAWQRRIRIRKKNDNGTVRTSRWMSCRKGSTWCGLGETEQKQQPTTNLR